MNFGENETNRWDSTPHVHQSSHSLINRLIRLRTTYWNRQYAIILLAYIGYIIVAYQFNFHYEFFEFLSDQNKLHINSSHYDYIHYYQYGRVIGLIPTGILATIYPAHNILGISVTISSILYLIIVMSIRYIDAHTHSFLQFCMGITLSGMTGSIDRVWTYWVPLNTQSIRHIPIILFEIIYNGEYLDKNIAALHHTYSSYTLTLSFGVIGLAWYILWLYVINDNQFRRLNCNIILFGGSNDSQYPLQKSERSLIHSIVSDIPWKSLFTSMPVLVIFLLAVCDGQLYIEKADADFDIHVTFDRQTRTFNIILLILIVILVELVPEIIVSISTTKIRKFWNWLYFGSLIIHYNLEAIVDNTLETNRIYHFILQEIEYLNYFGYFFNYLDIAPKYSSLISSLRMVVYYTFNIYYIIY
ncbi:vesicular glutamate transporter 1-like isoform X2 [Aphis gossypii]|uniref:vesicular glutamate transporter 1-like isoform X2 n=1 Tax=Aphis gossypii TaxID=80765 RepID=UPI00215957F5|nr:vesicular glutamate transporter 1-like isoform X2 [Aphis gossypii]